MSTSNLRRLRQGRFGGLAALAFALAGCGEKTPPAAPGSAPVLTKISVQTDWYAQPEHGGFYQALVKGYYREAARNGSKSFRVVL